MDYKLLALDVDGTLLNEKKKITPRVKAALIKIQHLGVQIVLASGRPLYGLLPLAKELTLDKNGGFIMACNGGQIIHAQTGDVWFEKHVDPKMLPYLERKAGKYGFPIFTYHRDTILTTHPADARVCREAELNGMYVRGVDGFADAVDFLPHKCMIVSEDDRALTELEMHWKRRLAGSLDVFRSEDYFLEIVPQYIDKAYALSWLMEKLTIEPKEVIAVGDGVCDVNMIQLAGLGVAMANARDSVKACADCVTGSNDAGGVATVAEKYILSAIHPSAVPLAQLNAQGRNALMGHLGIQYTYASADRVEATMPVDHRTRQPFGILHGGATLALAETVAGLGSFILCEPDEMMVGMQVSGNHLSSAHEGDTVRAVATIIHKGRSSHLWNVDVYTSTDKLISSVRVLNSIMKKW